jgi:histidyl-tRNA synthetase
MDFQPPRGTQDFLPPESEAVAALYRRATRLAQLYGYRRVETPVFDDTELFRRSSGQTSDVVSKEMYTFEDRGGRSLTLRPEGTAPVLRAYLGHAHSMPSPFKAFYLERMYRYGRPQAGRYREHRQFGLEVIGAAAGAADAEVIAVGNRFLRDVGLRRYELQLNSIGDATCRPAYRTELIAYLAANEGRLRDEHRTTFRDNPLRVLDCKDEACRAVAADAPKMIDRLCEECAAHFAAVRDELDRSGIAYTIVPTLVRGLDYYTRTAFEFVSLALSQAQASVFGGGRYDGLAEVLGGPSTPAVGYGLGLERVLLAMRDEGLDPEAVPEVHRLDCFVVAVGAADGDYARDVTERLRAAGLRTDRLFDPSPMKRQFRAAARAGARFAVVVGESELKEDRITARRLDDGEERTLGVDEGIAWIREPVSP